MSIHAIYGFFMRRFRPARAKEFGSRFPILFDARARILDVGGGGFPWSELKPAARITILNKSRPHSIPEDCGWEFVEGDGTNLPYADASFDLVFSNSVIEHVGDFDVQRKFANEMLRVGKRIYCQTPNMWFPVEPHLIAVFIHWLPFRMVRKLVRFASIWGWVAKPDQEKIDSFLKSTRLLNQHEVIDLFPNCVLRRERVFGLTKSFIVEKLSV
jgi:ubiquinone/menaquinone biosynthesis C-methylase UbiE